MNAGQPSTTHLVTPELLPIEDEVSDILGKVQRGLNLTDDQLADHAGITPDQVRQSKKGNYDPTTLTRLAFSLNLHAPSLLALAEGSWRPNIIEPFPGLAMFTTWYGDMTVNAFLVWDPETKEATSYDTGASCQPMLDFLAQHQLTLHKAFITHTHMDHLADIRKLQRETGAICYGSAIENPLGLKPLSHGDGLTLGCLQIRVLGTSGHTPGGQSYFIQGLKHPIVVVGDALFAGSMGGAPQAYHEALRNNRERLMTLPPETIICPGHGPQSTVGEEHAHNPFFPELKA